MCVCVCVCGVCLRVSVCVMCDGRVRGVCMYLCVCVVCVCGVCGVCDMIRYPSSASHAHVFIT